MDTHVHTTALDIQMLSIIGGAIIPILVGIVTKMSASSGLKAVVNFLLSAVAGAVAVAIEHEGAVNVEEWVVGIGMTWVISVATHYGLWKPTGASSTVQASTAGFGLGGEAHVAHP